MNLIVITDGEADDPDTLAYALAGFSDRLEEGRFPLNQLGVQFIQIGNDREATKFLKYLDDELRSNSSRRRDIVVGVSPLFCVHCPLLTAPWMFYTGHHSLPRLSDH